MGVGVQNGLWAHQSFARKMTWKLPDKLIVFSVQIEVTSKKKKIYTQIEPLFLSEMWWPPKKKGLHSNWTAISVQNVVTSKKKRSTLKLNCYFCPNCGDLQRPHLETVFLSSVRKILRGKLAQTTWNCPKFCPKFGYLTPTEGASAPPPPTPMDKFMTKTWQNSKVMMQYSAQKPRKMIGLRFTLYVFFC